jgi:hypothetical protein
MDNTERKAIRERVRKDFRLGRARLFRIEDEKRARAEIADDKRQIFAAFKQIGLEREAELTQRLAHLLMNFSKLASYRGVLEGYKIFQTGLELGEDRARFYLVEYLQSHPKARNSELARYLDRKNGRLAELRTNKDDPLWAPLRPSWQEMFLRKNITLCEGEYWETALKEFPDVVMPYLSRAREMAEEPRFKNVLFTWPRIIREHKKRRKRSDNSGKESSTGSSEISDAR